MTQTYLGLDDSLITPGTRETNAGTAREWLSALTGGKTGVAKGVGNELAVSEDSGGADMTVDIATGAAFVGDGTTSNVFYQNDSVAGLTIATADPTNARIDVIVVHLDLTQSAGEDTCQLAVVEGTPAGSPSVPALTQTATEYQFPIAHVAVAALATSIVDANITDVRTFTQRDKFVLRCSTDTALTTDLADMPGMSFYAEANKNYRITVLLQGHVVSGVDIKIHIDGPSGFTYDGLQWTLSGTFEQFESVNESTQGWLDTATTDQVFPASYNFQTGSAAGKVALQSEKNGGSVQTIYAGSFMIVEDIT